MNQSVAAISAETSLARTALDLLFKAFLVALSIALFVTVHELVHLVVGRLAGIPAVFLGLTSAGITPAQTAHYAPLPLALMNGVAPLFSVVVGFLVYGFLTRRPAALAKPMRYFLAWQAIFGIPYLGIQLMLVIQHVNYSGNGADSAAVAGYLHLPVLIRAGLHVIGFLYFMLSGFWVARTFLAVTPDMPRVKAETGVAAWRRMLGLLLTLLGIAGVVSGTVIAALHATAGDRFQGLGFLVWAIAAALLTSWKSLVIRKIVLAWLLPGIVGLLGLFPLSFINDGGNDYSEIWLIGLLIVIGALPFAARGISEISDFARIYRR